MRSTKNNQSGFGHIELILVIAVVVILGVVGWLVYKNDHKTKTPVVKTSSNKASTPTTSPTSTTYTNNLTGTTYPSDPTYTYAGWSTYTNSAYGFSIKYPQYVHADSACTFYSSTNDYGVKSGAVSTGVFEDGNNFYVAPTTSYRFTLSWAADQTTTDTACTPVPTTASTIQSKNSHLTTGAQYDYSVYNLPFFVEKIDSESGVTQALQQYWNDNTITISGWKTVSGTTYMTPTKIDCSAAEENQDQGCGPTSSNYSLQFYPKQQLMFYYVYGQANHLDEASISGSGIADPGVIDSFTAL